MTIATQKGLNCMGYEQKQLPKNIPQFDEAIWRSKRRFSEPK